MARTSDQSTGLSNQSTESSNWEQVAFAPPPPKLFNQSDPVPYRVPGLSPLVTHNSVKNPADTGGEGLVFVLGNLLVRGIKFIGIILSAIVNARRECEMALRNRLLDAQWRLEREEIDAAEFAEMERQVMMSLRLLRQDY